LKTLDERMMALALTQARKGWGRTSPNPMVGAVVAKGETVIATGFHARAGGPHAEVVALERAGAEARGAALYVTLEPCHHHGRTPPCTQAILDAGIERVVIGERDPNPHVPGKGAEYLAARGLEVYLGVLEARCSALNEFFRKHITTGRPFVLLKSAAGLDGKIAAASGHSRWVTGEKTRAYVHRLRNGVDAILVGRGTAAADDPSLNTRLPGRRRGRDPIRILVDTRLNTPLSARIFDRNFGGPTIVGCGPSPNEVKVQALRGLGVEVWPLPLCQGRVSLAALTERLGQKGLTSLLIEGGSEVNAAALLIEKIVDKIIFCYAPKIIGGRTAPTLVGGPGTATVDESLRVDIVKIRRLGLDFIVEAVPRY